jgi:hypothetical protein
MATIPTVTISSGMVKPRSRRTPASDATARASAAMGIAFGAAWPKIFPDDCYSKHTKHSDTT